MLRHIGWRKLLPAIGVSIGHMLMVISAGQVSPRRVIMCISRRSWLSHGHLHGTPQEVLLLELLLNVLVELGVLALLRVDLLGYLLLAGSLFEGVGGGGDAGVRLKGLEVLRLQLIVVLKGADGLIHVAVGDVVLLLGTLHH